MNPTAQAPVNPIRVLRRKEWIESKSALFVGLIIFVGLPTVWTLLLWSLDTHAGIQPGLALMLWLCAGGLFAAVLGAQVVCRDLGSPTERFLLSRPITQIQVIRTKGWAGFLLLALIAVSIGVLEVLWWTIAKATHRHDSLELGPYFLGTGLSICAYWIAFAAACATRRSLTSVLAAAFVLTLLITVPLIVRIPGIQDISDLASSNGPGYQSALLAVTFVLVTWLCAELALRCFSTTDRRINMEPKAMAWIVCLTLTGLFVLAMREVGATEPLVTTWWGPPWIESNVAGHSFELTAGHGRIVARPMNSAPTVLIDVDSHGRITRQRQTYLTEPRMRSEQATAIDVKGNLVVVGIMRKTGTLNRPDDPLQMFLHTYDWELMSLSSKTELPMPAVSGWCFVADAYCTDSRMFVLIVSWKTAKNSNNIVSYTCTVAEYEQFEGSALLKSTRWCSFASMHWSEGPRWATVGGFTSGDSLRVESMWSGEYRLSAVKLPDVFESLDARSDRFGLHVFPGITGAPSTQSWPTDSKGAIGHAYASPWAAVFRTERPNVLPIGNGRLLEMHSFSLIEYDMSDPTHPTRIAHMTSPPIYEVEVMDDLLVISHHRGFSIAKLPAITKR